MTAPRGNGRARSPAQRRAAAEARHARRAAVTDADVVMAAATAFLAVRQRSVSETQRRLRVLGYPPALCDQVTDRLVVLGYLDDLAFARAWVESRDRARPRGSLALRQELARKGVARDIVDQVLGERAEARSSAAAGDHEPVAGAFRLTADPDSSADMAAAERLLARRGASLRRETEPRRQRQKTYALLARAGFSPDVCRTATAAFCALSEPLDGDA